MRPTFDVVVGVFLMTACPVFAAPAPHLDWRTIATPCCDVHFPADLADAGRHVAELVDECAYNAGLIVAAAPADRVQVVVHDVVDTPNGFASVVPYDRLELRAVTPEDDSELARTDDWLRLLVQHEMLHVVHLDVVHGLPAVVNVVLGKSWPPNVFQPRLIIEGLATYAETRFTAGGRLRSSLFAAPMRIAALAGDLWSLDDASNTSRRPPGGGGAYVYGAFFVDFLTRRHGPGVWADIAHDYGTWPIPYAVQRTFAVHTGRDLQADWRDFLDEVRRDATRFRDRVLARGGPTPARRLTRSGGAVRTPTFAADGALLVAVAPPNGPAGIHRLQGLPAATPRLTPLVRTNDVADVTIVDDVVVFSQTETHATWRSYRDLFTVSTQSGIPVVRQLTFGARLRNPAALPGERAVIAEHRTGQRSSFVIVDVDSGSTTEFVSAPAGSVLYGPAPSPDGRTVAASVLDVDGRRKIVTIDRQSRTIDVVVGGPDADRFDPSWSPDGRFLVFADDRDGAWAIHAVELVSGIVRRIVDTLGNASQPVVTPDGRAVVFADQHLDGLDLFVAAFAPEEAPVVPGVRQPLVAGSLPGDTKGTAATPAAPLHAASAAYSPWATLGPRSWLPLLESDPLRGITLGGQVEGADAAGLVSWTLRAALDVEHPAPDVNAAIRLANLYLPLDVELALRPVVSESTRTNDGMPELQRDLVVRATTLLSLPLRRRRFSHLLAAGFQYAHSIDQVGRTSAPDALLPRVPPSVTRPRSTTLVLDWSSTGSESYRDSVSSERGIASFVRLRLGDERFLSDVTVREVFVDVDAFTAVPGLANHVLAVALSGGAAFDDRPGALFVTGGLVGRDLLQDIVGGRRGGAGAVRGFPGAHLIGDALAAATFEYRLPLLEFERGLETLPLFVERLSGCAFVDTAAAFDENSVARASFATGLGGELRLELLLGYAGSFVVRAGLARGVTAGGVDQGYVVLGSTY